MQLTLMSFNVVSGVTFPPFCGVNVHDSMGNGIDLPKRSKESILYVPIKRMPLKSSIFMEHNAENLMLIRRTHDELRAGKQYRLILSSKGALYAENHELFEVRFVLPVF